MLKIGDWVLVAHGSERIIGYIRDFSRLRNEVYIIQVSTYFNKRISRMKPVLGVIDVQYIVPLGLTLAKEDWDSMIDMAVSTDDQKWFLELSRRMTGHP
ncbi:MULTISPECIES: hypothetical protein [Bacillaceae]|uniref:IDEAL domain-containing protein n=1 Tax=Domibacillus aminovorans TaxID=29332 RepID=A0A177KX20_9BACI|nr:MULTISPECIES: hypothetical protein [Bacillaceae]OAH57919.1 hypothetical protein AWH48_02620 [Domibacillus aminovorans]